MNERTGSECTFCDVDLDTAPVREKAYLTPLWRLVAHRSALPGWMLLMPRRHIESLHELTGDEAAELGPLIRAASAVHIDAFGAQKTYVMQFAEGIKHVHFSLAPRRGDIPQDRLGAASMAFNSTDEPLSEMERDEIAGRIRAAWPDDWAAC